METNLDHNHAESKCIRFTRDYTNSLENFWRGPCRGIFIDLRCGIHFTNDRSELEIRQTSVAIMINENVGLAKGYR